MKNLLLLVLLTLLLSCQSKRSNYEPAIKKEVPQATIEEEHDSIRHIKWYNAKRDSLQSIVYPVDSLLPFGPKALGKLVNDDVRTVTFSVDTANVLIEKNMAGIRRTIFESWVYYLNFHLYIDVEKYYDNRLPPIKTHEFVKLNEQDSLIRSLGIYDEAHPFDPYDAQFAARIAGVNDFEIYYTTTGTFGDGNDCDNYSKSEESCCFLEDYQCNTTGSIILYNRKKQHSIIIPAYLINHVGQDGLMEFRFFYVSKDGAIHIFEGYSIRKYESYGWDRKERSKTVVMEKAYKITVSPSGKVAIEQYLDEED